MESLSNDSSELSAEFVLSDIIHSVCQFLQIRDLYSVAKVCKSWQKAAVHEMNKKGPEAIVMPYFGKPMITSSDSNFSLLDLIHTKPTIALLFFNRSHFKQFGHVNLDYIITTYKEQLECDIIGLDSEESYFNTNSRVNQENFDDLNLNHDFGIPSLFLSNFKQSNIVISYCMKEDGISSAMLAQRMYKELISNYQDSKITLILLAASQKGTNIARKLLSMIQRNHDQTRCSIWGNEFYSLKEVDYNPLTSPVIKEPTLIGIRIFSSSIESWSFFIDASLKLDKFEEQLVTFKDNIILKRHSIGLACGPALAESGRDLQDSVSFMNLIKKVFPETLFIGDFSYEFYFNAYGCDSTNKVGGMNVTMSIVSIMIFTHD